MAIKKLTIDGYGQVELNNVAFRRDGRIEAQCELSEDFINVAAENGMLLTIDRVSKKVSLPTAGMGPADVIALKYTAEKLYYPTVRGLKDFRSHVGGMYPRMGFLSIGDKFTTNLALYKDTEFETEEIFVEALGAATALYGGISAQGAILVSKVVPATAGPVLKVIERTTMPDGQLGIKFQVIGLNTATTWIDDYVFTFTPTIVAEDTSATVTWETNAEVESIEYTLDSGAAVALTAGELSAKSFMIDLLTAETAYTLNLKVKEADVALAHNITTINFTTTSTIDDYVFTFTPTIVAEDTSATVTWETNAEVESIEYTLDSETAVALTAGELLAKSFVIGSLTAATAYTLNLEVKEVDVDLAHTITTVGFTTTSTP